MSLFHLFLSRFSPELWQFFGFGRENLSKGPVTLQSPKITLYDYRDENSALVFQVVRQEPARDGRKKDFYQRRPNGSDWINDLKGVRLVLYRLPEILQQDSGRIVFVPEGEKCVDAFWAIDAVATTNAGGAGKWRQEYNEHLRARHIVILPDNDDPGCKHAADVARSLHGVAASVRILELPGLQPKGDVVDWLAGGGDKNKLLALAAAAPLYACLPKKEAESPQGERKPKKQPIATVVVRLAQEGGARLFRTPDGVAYAVAPCGDHTENLRVRSSLFSAWLRRTYYALNKGAIPGAQAISDAIATLESVALYGSPTEAVHLRVAERDNKLYIDLADNRWQGVEIDPNGWRIVDKPPVRFRRSRAMQPLPEPKRGGSLDQLRPFLNVSSDDDWRLCIAWLLASLRPQGPYPLLVLSG